MDSSWSAWNSFRHRYRNSVQSLSKDEEKMLESIITAALQYESSHPHELLCRMSYGLKGKEPNPSVLEILIADGFQIVHGGSGTYLDWFRHLSV